LAGDVGEKGERIGRAREKKGSEGVEMACLKDSRRIVARHAAAADIQILLNAESCIRGGEKKKKEEGKTREMFKGRR